MKTKLITALTVPVLLATNIVPAIAITTYNECGSRGTCSYDRDTYYAESISSGGGITGWTDESTCKEHTDCWVPGYNLCLNPDMGYDMYLDDCGKNCLTRGYDVAVLGPGSSDGAYSMGCACSPVTRWQTYKTGVSREYVRNATTGAPCAVTATSNFRCNPGYYGTPDSNGNGCIPCTGEEMYCNGGTTFDCGDGWYKNAAKNGCVKCPNSKEGNLGYGSTGAAVGADGGGDAITDCYFGSGTILRDDTGTFTIVDNDCYYKQ